LFNLWRPLLDDGDAARALQDELPGFEMIEARHPQSGISVLRVRVAWP